MAFPASPSNNQVHKESGQNRAWVYDSTLGTWDQLREIDRLSAEAGGGVFGNIGKGEGGQVLQTVHKPYGQQFQLNTTNGATTLITNGVFPFELEMTVIDPTNYFLLELEINCCSNTSGGQHQGNIGFTIRENSSGSAVHVKDIAGDLYQGDGARTGVDQVKDQQMIHLGYDRFPDAAVNVEGIRFIAGRYLTRLGDQTPAISTITWSVWHFTGDVNQTFFNSAQSVTTSDNWGVAGMSSLTVQEIVKG